MIAASVTIDRASLSLTDLTISNTPTASGMWLESVAEPGFSFRKRYAPDSDTVAGSVLLAATLDASQLPMTVNIRAASSAALATQKAVLAAALSQFTYDLTLTIDGVATTYAAECVWPAWVTDPGMADAFLAKTSVVIPLDPPGA